MQWHSEDPALSIFHDPIDEDAAVAMSAVADYRHLLLPGEAESMGRMAEVRQLGFSSGRHCAHLAQSLLGLSPQGVLREERVPVWPAGSVGAITHSDDIAAAIASTEHLGVGIDIEATGRVEESMYRILFTAAEQEALKRTKPALNDADTLMFSAKESVYKAIFPTGRKFIGFREVEVHMDPDKQTYTMTYLGEHAPNAAMNRGIGYWLKGAGHVLTLFFIPRD